MAGPLCQAVTQIIHDFERKQMDYHKPRDFLLVLFDRDKLWEKRHYELFYLKYLCITYSTGDESKLFTFIRKVSMGAETLPLSAYNSFVDKLKELVNDIDLGKSHVIPREYAFFQGEAARMSQLYQAERAENARKDHIITQKDQEISKKASENQSLVDEMNKKNQQIESMQQTHNNAMERMNQRMDALEAFIHNNPPLNQTPKNNAYANAPFFKRH